MSLTCDSLPMLLLWSFLVVGAMSGVRGAGELGEEAGRVDTSKALFFRNTNEGISSYVRGSSIYKEGRDTIIDVDGLRDAVRKSSSSSSTTNNGDAVHSRRRRSTDFLTADKDAIVATHNEGRSMVTPEAANMKTMEWDDDLATMAQQWSDGCYYEHGNPTNISPFSAVGQNLYIKYGLSAPGTPPDGTAATEAWYNEYQYYDYDTMGCQAGEQCGHYTQNVWASTYAVGCGLTFCDTATDEQGRNFNGAWLITCNYGPAGNYVGSSPYEEGASCTKCASGSGLCKNNLCNDCSTSDPDCQCKASCQNCATLNSDCTCTCTDGFYGSDCSTPCEDTHEYCGANPGWPVSWCDRDYVINGCPLMCSICNEADPDFVCDSDQLTANGVDVLLYEDISEWDSIQASVLGSFRTSVINYCSTRQSTCCPAANGTDIDFSSTGLTLHEDYPMETQDYGTAAYWLRVVGISPVAPGVCNTNDGGFLSPDVVRAAIDQDHTSLESSLNIEIAEIMESAAVHPTASTLVIFLSTILTVLLSCTQHLLERISDKDIG